MGSRDVLAQRIARLLEAERTGDKLLVRAAAFEVSAAAAEWAATLDLDPRVTAP